ncbi:hypothetical protein [Azospirillum sp. B2RO_4]|uniref:hypothetical protein n=1 Tax=Azospirillum sp. B2RO_4 TaxID=3027796 RepID=UPI003DA7BB71
MADGFPSVAERRVYRSVSNPRAKRTNQHCQRTGAAEKLTVRSRTDEMDRHGAIMPAMRIARNSAFWRLEFGHGSAFSAELRSWRQQKPIGTNAWQTAACLETSHGLWKAIGLEPTALTAAGCSNPIDDNLVELICMQSRSASDPCGVESFRLLARFCKVSGGYLCSQ